ncbi:hypothetical protein AYI69_g436 [Smittium culicis]|uniref:Core-binding (CB) domain-containing protein n=1 Tax=Smittium culicis TaxID=133412 RepID=A0A1R1YT10_9FUNG|nr:hypothetical protein AYI69_g436 [Smittium culicis]
MDHQDINQIPMSQDQVKELTDMVKELLRDKERNAEPEDPYVTTRIPLTDLAVYPELIEALPSIEEDFFRTPLTEEERKEAIHSCTRSSSMNYQPPPLNDSASTAVKKADACLHGIQVALAQATRPIDYYVHRRIQENPQITEDDPHILFANTMRVLLSDIAATVTQGRLDNLHKGMELPGKPTLSLPAVMENGNMVPGSPEAISLPTAITTGNHRNTRPEKRKITSIEQQELVSYGVENQRSFLKTQGLSDSAINIIFSNERSVKRRSRYHSTQQNFLEWNLNNNQSSAIQPSHVVNYLAHLFTTRKLSVNTIKSYKSAILNLVADPRTMENSHCMKEFLKAIEETEIKSFVNPVINITPVIEKLHEWVKRRSRYHSTQQNFLEWNLNNNQSSAIQPSHVVNYLAHLFTTRKLSVNTIKSYKSAILNLVADPRTMENSHCMKEFLKAIEETEIKSFVNPVINITPVIEKLHEWGENNKLDIMKLTTKCCWLLALCGFLRASDIHRIDDARTTICNGTLNIVIIAPKEKRKGQQIERPCEINSHPNPILCPVAAYTVYKSTVATELCPTPHTNNKDLTINVLFRNTKDKNKPLSVDSITRHIKNLSRLIDSPPNTPIPKARAIGATLAATSGVPAENIVSHAFWSNFSMFDTYYRLNRSTQSNMTEAVLPLD